MNLDHGIPSFGIMPKIRQSQCVQIKYEEKGTRSKVRSNYVLQIEDAKVAVWKPCFFLYIFFLGLPGINGDLGNTTGGITV